jgi:SAM-dependent methyltransferase
MSTASDDPRNRELVAFYTRGHEEARLASDDGRLEFERTCDLLARLLPPAPSRVLDVGGGTGRYAEWLAGRGHEVVMLDPVPLHVEQAQERTRTSPFEAALGDARDLFFPDASFDAAIALGPLYHLVERDDRVQAIREAVRVVKPGAPLAFAAVSRLASLLGGTLASVSDPAFWEIVEGDLRDGRHVPGADGRYFVNAYFHGPEHLRSEGLDGGLDDIAVLAVEGPFWLLRDLDERWRSPESWRLLLDALRRIERDDSALGVSCHLLLTGRRPV